MHWVIFMFNDKEPLMFIDNVQPQIQDVKTQNVFDSRKSKKTMSTLDAFENKKIENVIQMYQKGRPVLCSIILEEEEIVGIPVEKDNTFIKVQLSEEEMKEIRLNAIQEINIIKF